MYLLFKIIFRLSGSLVITLRVLKVGPGGKCDNRKCKVKMAFGLEQNK